MPKYSFIYITPKECDAKTSNSWKACVLSMSENWIYKNGTEPSQLTNFWSFLTGMLPRRRENISKTTITLHLSTFWWRGLHKTSNSLISYHGRINHKCWIITNTHAGWILKVSSSWGKGIKNFINVFKVIRFFWFPFQPTKIPCARESKHFEGDFA
jgi:hypothetical protein